MNTWTSGYVSEIPYTYGYYTELNPLRMRLPFLNLGIRYPKIKNACELGFGQGVSINIHAAAGSAKWYGTDFNPSQCAFAKELANAYGCDGTKFSDEAFAEFCTRPDLPMFDYIGLHGIWSWISEENRGYIVDFINRKLNVGGVVYVSYNTQPGWGAMLPMRELLVEYVDRMVASGDGVVKNISSALEFVEKMAEYQPEFLRVNPIVAERLKGLKGQKKNYLAHEYFNRDWNPISFSEMHRCLSAAKMDYVGSAHYPDHVDAINLAPEQLQWVKEIRDPVFRELVRDFFVNQQFRRDYWVKGACRYSKAEQIEGIEKVRVILGQPLTEISKKVSGARGVADIQESYLVPIAQVLADYQPREIGQIVVLLSDKGLSFASIVQTLMLMIAVGAAYVVHDESDITAAKTSAERLNEHLLESARHSSNVVFLASPVTGGGVPVSNLEQLFIQGVREGFSELSLDRWAVKVLAGRGEYLLKDGIALKSELEACEFMREQRIDFFAKKQRLLGALGITTSSI